MTYISLNIPVPDMLVFIHICIVLRCKEICCNCKLRAIKLTLGKYAIVSLEDYEKLNRHKWRALRSPKCFYAVRSEKGKTIYMHNEVLAPAPGMVIDHIDHNGLNNSRQNLQLATRSQNACNRRKRDSKCTSKYKGVWFNKREGKWMSAIKVDGKRIYLGYFDNEFDAARAYDIAAKKYHGKFAVLNFG
ncbi:MAG: AP2/ERF family transcription factor [Phycisphaerae bacterium]|jgi:hypothetical protein